VAVACLPPTTRRELLMLLASPNHQTRAVDVAWSSFQHQQRDLDDVCLLPTRKSAVFSDVACLYPALGDSRSWFCMPLPTIRRELLICLPPSNTRETAVGNACLHTPQERAVDYA
jgi:hypothetical protein